MTHEQKHIQCRKKNIDAEDGDTNKNDDANYYLNDSTSSSSTKESSVHFLSQKIGYKYE